MTMSATLIPGPAGEIPAGDASRSGRPPVPVPPALPGAATTWASDSECLNPVRGPQFETYLTRDVVGWIDGHHRTVPQAEGRAIGGMSSGGYCAPTSRP